MAKPKAEAKPVKILSFFKAEGAYGFKVLEIDPAILEQHGKLLESPNPDIFAVCVNNIVKKARDIFEI